MNIAATLVPKSRIGKMLATTWLMCCFAVLVFGFVQRSLHDMPIAFTWFLFFLSFPVGSLAIAAVGLLVGDIQMKLGLHYYPFWYELPIWFAAVILGYLQWFVALPMLGRSFKRLTASSERLP